ncbi:MAG: flagellar M-ring protein FliF C-terminal domain-containing protein [Clostridia bacterium]
MDNENKDNIQEPSQQATSASTQQSSQQQSQQVIQTEKVKQMIDDAVKQIKENPIKALIFIVPIIALIITASLYMGAGDGGYRVLYAGLDATETTEIFSLLKLKGADPQLNSDGEVMVLAEEFDIWLLQLAAEGYPKSGSPNYSYYADNSGMTTTQSELDQWAHYQLQEEIATTVKRINGVTDASVLISLPNTSDYIWDKATNTEVGTVAIMLTPQVGVELSTEQVNSIKTIVAAGVPGVSADDVKIVNSRTSLEMGTTSSNIDGLTNTITALQNYELEAIVQKQLESNIVRLLSSRYGNDGVVATVKATLNYDKMISESVELFEKPDGGGFVTEAQGYYQLDGNVNYGGLVGEEDNDDIPTYAYGTVNDEDITHFSWHTYFDYSYIKSQVEAGYAVLERATVSVLVAEENMTEARQAELISLISMSADIPPELITVSAINSILPGESESDTLIIDPLEFDIFAIIPWYYMVLALFLIILIIALIVFIKKRKRAKQLAKQNEAERLLEEQRIAAERALEDYKNNIATSVHSEENDKQEAIIDEIRDFTDQNPEIATSLIKNWLKDGE